MIYLSYLLVFCAGMALAFVIVSYRRVRAERALNGVFEQDLKHLPEFLKPFWS
jgi:hypothetical protein